MTTNKEVSIINAEGCDIYDYYIIIIIIIIHYYFNTGLVAKTACADKLKYSGHFKLKFKKQRQKTILTKTRIGKKRVEAVNKN